MPKKFKPLSVKEILNSTDRIRKLLDPVAAIKKAVDPEFRDQKMVSKHLTKNPPSQAMDDIQKQLDPGFELPNADPMSHLGGQQQQFFNAQMADGANIVREDLGIGTAADDANVNLFKDQVGWVDPIEPVSNFTGPYPSQTPEQEFQQHEDLSQGFDETWTEPDFNFSWEPPEPYNTYQPRETIFEADMEQQQQDPQRPFDPFDPMKKMP